MSGEPLAPYQNNAQTVIETFVTSSPHTELRPHSPPKQIVDFTEQTLKTMKRTTTPETLHKISQRLTDFDGDDLILSGICTTTDLMTHMFLKEKDKLPTRWSSNEGYIRTIISMAANLDIAQLKNVIFDQEYDRDLSSPQKRTNEDIESLEKLIQNLQARASVPASGQTT